MSTRDDFPPKTRRIMAERAGFIRSNPACRNNTIQAHTDSDKSVSTGRAAHICAASPGGPRYDPTQTPAERMDFANGVWLCATCGDLVDRDVPRFPADTLRGWKQAHEAWVGGQGMIPKWPEIRVEGLPGLLDQPGPQLKVGVTAEDCRRFRDWRLELSNPNRVRLSDLDFSVQFPEPIVGLPVPIDHPAGVFVQFQRNDGGWVSQASGQAKAVFALRDLLPNGGSN